MTLTEAEREVLGLIDESELVGLTQALVRVPGENPPGEEAATAAVLMDLARERGLQVEAEDVAPERPNVVVTLPGGSGRGPSP